MRQNHRALRRRCCQHVRPNPMLPPHRSVCCGVRHLRLVREPPQPAPNRSRYAVLWNSPWPSECKMHEGGSGGPIDWAAHSVAVNDEAAFNGEVVVDLYRTGLFPRFLGNGTAVNGGVPQSTDFSLSLHLAALTEIINEDVPSVGFRGVGVLDFEDWYAQWEWHGPPHLPLSDHYWNASIELAATADPSLKGKALVAAAKEAWLKAAQDVMIASIEHAKQMRPQGLWGYYSRILPPDDCVVTSAAIGATENPCSAANDDLPRLWESVDAIMPSIYLARNDTAVSTGGVDSYVGEATRLALAAGKRRKDGIAPLVIPFVCTTYGNWIDSAGVDHKYTQWVDAADAALELARPAEWGGAGIVVWGGSIDTTNAKRCAEGRAAFDTALAPVLKAVAAKTSACAAARCSGHGRCATLPEVACLCDAGWSGTSCQTARTSSVKTDDASAGEVVVSYSPVPQRIQHDKKASPFLLDYNAYITVDTTNSSHLFAANDLQAQNRQKALGFMDTDWDGGPHLLSS